MFFFFVPPYMTFQIDRPSDTVGLSVFFVVGSLSIYLITTLNMEIDVSICRTSTQSGQQSGIFGFSSEQATRTGRIRASCVSGRRLEEIFPSRHVRLAPES
jgi:K+-sensing histidine kinase KdpD